MNAKYSDMKISSGPSLELTMQGIQWTQEFTSENECRGMIYSFYVFFPQNML